MLASPILQRASSFAGSLSPSLRNLLRQILREEGGAPALQFALEQHLLDVDPFVALAEKIVGQCFVKHAALLILSAVLLVLPARSQTKPQLSAKQQAACDTLALAGENPSVFLTDQQKAQDTVQGLAFCSDLAHKAGQIDLLYRYGRAEVEAMRESIVWNVVADFSRPKR